MDTIILTKLIDMPFIFHGGEVSYVRRLYAFFRKYREMSTEEGGLDWMPLYCFEPPYDKFYLVRDAFYWCCEIKFERRQCMKVRGRKLVGFYNLKMFAISSRERDMFYQASRDVWRKCESAGALRILTPIFFCI